MDKLEIKGRYLFKEHKTWITIKKMESDHSDDFDMISTYDDLISHDGFWYLPLNKIKITDELACSRDDLGPVWIMVEIYKNIFDGPYELLAVLDGIAIFRTGQNYVDEVETEDCRPAKWEEIPE